MTPTISQVTPMLLIRDIQLTPMQLMMVVSTSSTEPSSTALAAPLGEVSAVSSPTIWNPLQIDGSTTCSAMAAAEAVTICARIMNQPANQPIDLAAHPPRPLVDRAGDRVAGGEFGEAERDHELADEHARPGPEEGRSAEPEAETEQLEDRGQDRDEREAGGEGRELAQRAVQLLVVAELGEVVGIADLRGTAGGRSRGRLRCCSHGESSWSWTLRPGEPVE